MLGRSVCGSSLAPQLGGAARLECDACRSSFAARRKSIRFRQSDRLAGALWRPALAAAVPATGIVAIMGNSRANHDWSLLYSGRRSLVNRPADEYTGEHDRKDKRSAQILDLTMYG